MLKVGTHEVVHIQHIQLYEGQDAWLEFQVGEWKPRFHIVLSSDDTTPNPQIHILGKNDHGEINLVNALKGKGTIASSQSLQVGFTQDKPLMVSIYQTSTGNSLLLYLQFSLAGGFNE